MDIKQIRYKNARYLLKNEALGVNDFADKIGRSQSQTSAYISERPTKNIGDKIARLIEQAFSKPNGWLDTINRESDSTDGLEPIIPDMDTRQLTIPGLIDSNAADHINDRSSKIRELRRNIRNLEKEKTDEYNRMNNFAISYCANEFENKGYKVRYVHEDHELNWLYPGARFKENEFDLVVENKEGTQIGFYFWMVVLKQYRTPLPTFNIDVKNPEIEARVALFVHHGHGFNFFFLPISELIMSEAPILSVVYSQRSAVNDDGEIETFLSLDDYKINNKSILQYKDSFNIEVDDITSEHQMRQLKEYLEAKIKHLDEKLQKK